jgi:hypothetical protein
MMRRNLSAFSIGAVLVAGLVASGCRVPDGGVAAMPPLPMGEAPELPTFEAEAGVRVAALADPTHAELRNLAKAMAITPRADPFSLLEAERRFEAAQASERMLNELGAFALFYEEPPRDPVEEQLEEQQPLRRLSGIIQGEGVIALIEMEDGRVHEIRPGTQIEGTEWTVLSIDSEGAVLHREGNRRPREIYVRLQGAFDGRPAGGEIGAPGPRAPGPGAPGDLGDDMGGREGMEGPPGEGPFGPGGRDGRGWRR